MKGTNAMESKSFNGYAAVANCRPAHHRSRKPGGFSLQNIGRFNGNSHATTMKKLVYICFGLLATHCPVFVHRSAADSVPAFEGRISAISGRGAQPGPVLYTIGTNCIRVEMTDTNQPNAIDILDRNSGQMTLIYPHNGSFVRFNVRANTSSASPPGFPRMPAGLPPGIGPQARANMPAASARPVAPQMPMPPQGLPPGIGPTNLSGMPTMPARPGPPEGLPPGIGPQAQAPGAAGPPALPNLPGMPGNPGMRSMPMMPMMPEGMELQAAGEKSTLLGYPCERYDIKQHGEAMEIWATDQLPPFQAYLPIQPPSFAPPMIEEQWARLVSARKLFPLRATLRADNGVERYRFEVQSITPARLTENDYKRFQPPEGYVEIQSRTF
jgi:hypothetical protein